MHSLIPLTLEQVPQALRDVGWSVSSSADFTGWLQTSTQELKPLAATWNDLPPDAHLRDGGRYRFRRHGCFVVEADGQVSQVPHRAHWQSVDYNALHGGIERWFEPILPWVCKDPLWQRLLGQLGQLLADLKGTPRWYVEAHQFRVDTAGGIGRPTPEGAHRDGVDFVAVILLGRQGIKGGETRVFEAEGPRGVRFTLEDPWSILLLNDARVIHESTPIQPMQDH